MLWDFLSADGFDWKGTSAETLGTEGFFLPIILLCTVQGFFRKRGSGRHCTARNGDLRKEYQSLMQEGHLKQPTYLVLPKSVAYNQSIDLFLFQSTDTLSKVSTSTVSRFLFQRQDRVS